MGLEPASVRSFTLININISATNGSITIKFYLERHRGWGKAANGSWQDRIETLVSMATDNFHFIML